jgi:predicted acyl esterase
MVEKGSYFAKRGLIFVAQDCRGRFKSEGEFYGYADEPIDGYDTVEWIAGQSWSDKKVGTMGTSYGGWVQSALALQNPPNLASMFPNVSIFNSGLHSVRHAGALEMRWLAWTFLRAVDSKEAAENPNIGKALIETRFDELITHWPIKKGQTPLSLIPIYEKFAFDIITNSDYDDFWRRTGKGWMGEVEEHLENHADVPMYYSGGWYDSYCRSTTEFYNKMSEAKKSPVKLIMGPWTHGDAEVFARTYSGDVDFGPESAIDYNALRLRWFDQTLKEIDTGILEEPPIRIFIMGGGNGRRNSAGRLNHGGEWRNEYEWPLARTVYTKYYLQEEGQLSSEPPKKERSSTSYIFDPELPVPTIGGNLSSLQYLQPIPEGYEALEELSNYERSLLFRKPLSKVGAHNQIEAPDVYGAKLPYLSLSSRHDVLVFQTTPLTADVEVTGPLKVELWASSSNVDTDFTAKLIDVHPPNEDYPKGYAMNLADSIIRARYRKSFEKQEFIEPGMIYKFTIQPYPTGNLFKKRHKIRLDISSSNWPRFDINPNTGEPLGLNTRSEKATNTVYHEAAHPSHIILPIIPKLR